MKSILVIDPSEATRSLIKWTGIQNGYIVTDTPTVSDALMYFEIQTYDYILIDVFLSKELLTASHRLPYNSTFILMMPPDTPPNDILVSSEFNVDYIFKPFDETSLLLRLEKYFKPSLGTILALDISGIITPCVRRMINTLGYKIQVIDTDKNLKHLLAELKPNLFIVDAAIPPLNRDTTIDLLSQNTEILTLAVIHHRHNTADIRSHIRLFSDFIVGPINPTELQFRIGTLLNFQSQSLQKEPSLPNQSPAQPSHEKALLTQIYVTLHHEIKSPLTGILIGAQALSNHVSKEEKPVVTEIIESAKKIQQTLDTLAISSVVRSEEYMNGTQMAKFETPHTPGYHWI